MSWASSEAIAVLWFLLPGFVATGLFRTLISNPKPSGFDSLAQVFIFTVIVQVATRLVLWKRDTELTTTVADDTTGIAVSVLIAIIAGLSAAWLWNKDLPHSWLRSWKLTRQSSYRSAQYSAFAFHTDCYVVLHLKGERRLFGWPREWPSRPDDQHFLIEECEWLEEKGRSSIDGVSHMLIPASEVEMIEFLPMATETDNED
ncbi:MAG: DUF6338 family protein [Gammaproteobacteria bacterium]|nr:DUF6338 family protein [Gammaproteobacteria bacterium]